nr:enoyl-CoA hydratase/isomerase family protein [Sphingomonas sp. CDS-1]
MIDTLELEDFGPLGTRPVCIIDTAESAAHVRAPAVRAAPLGIVIGVDRAGSTPALDAAAFDVLLTTAADPPAPWVHVPAGRLEDRLGDMIRKAEAAPVAASIALATLRIVEAVSVEAGLQVESLAYSVLLGSDAFRRWREAHPRANESVSPPAALDGAVAMTRDDDRVAIELARPESRNAMNAEMRDALFGALAAQLDDPTRPGVEVSGRGACFSVGGDIDEFGSLTDAALGHCIRTARSCALLLHRLGERAHVVLHGACIGSGIEIPAAAAHRIGRPGAFFQLPELGMGLMPGAGGTVTLTRRIGRHRTAYMFLTGRRIDAATALRWGLLSGMRTA